MICLGGHSMTLRNIFTKILNHIKITTLDCKKVYFTLLIFIFLFTVCILPSSFASLQPVKSVETYSEKLNYLDGKPGSWKITQTAKWLSKDKARLTIDVDSILDASTKYNDVYLVLDVSSSMGGGERLARTKFQINNVIDNLLSSNNNRVGLITFADTSEVTVNLTTDQSLLTNKINSIIPLGPSSYYQALKSVDEVLKSYKKDEGRECTFVFLTAGVPNRDSPNEVAYFKYLKTKYSYPVINNIQYEMGNSVLNFTKNISDNQFIAHEDNLSEILLQAATTSKIYENFEVKVKIKSDYFSIDNININNNGSSIQDADIITWNLENFRSGSSATLNIDTALKETADDTFIISDLLDIKSVIGDIEESVSDRQSPIIKNNYQVVYDGNAPNDCTVTDIPNQNSKYVYDTVEISPGIPKCKGYQFKGWKLQTVAEVLNDNYFIMPEENVILRAEWTKINLKKTMNGKVYEYIPPVLQSVSSSYNKEIWAYKDSTTKVVFQNEMKKVPGSIAEYDISEEKNLGIMAYIVPNSDNSTYTTYIQSDGIILANSNSRYLFYGFEKLKEIVGLEHLDTSNAKYMSSMFQKCTSLVDLNLSSFKTSNVTNMSNMFNECSNLKNLNLSNFDTSKVLYMNHMFNVCNSLTSLNLNNFNTSQVTTMQAMFGACRSLTSLNLNNFDTSNVKSMESMFADCNNLVEIYLKYFNTEKVINMIAMFSGCNNLRSLDLSSFNTSKVTNMNHMFNVCNSLTSLNLNNFNTSQVTSMEAMFGACSSLKQLQINNFELQMWNLCLELVLH